MRKQVIIMHLITCLDDSNGMLFNKRRQSQDCLVREDILNNLQGSKLWMNSYSAGQFKETSGDFIFVDENFMFMASEHDYCFAENVSLTLYLNEINSLILYYWNKKYPADRYFDIDLSDWELKNTAEFAGNSHEKITKKIYLPKK